MSFNPKLNISVPLHCVATGAKPPAKEGEGEAEVWPQAKEAGGERGRVPPSERKTGSTNKCERFFTFWFR